MITTSIPMQNSSSMPRQTNIELFRMLAMFLVLVVHADFLGIGVPTTSDLSDNVTSTLVRVLFQSISIIAVDCFILISGWFSIKPSIKGFCNFLFQCIYFYLGLGLVACIFGLEVFSLSYVFGLIKSMFSNWFVSSYIALYILSPILNSFVDNTSKKKLKCVGGQYLLFLIFFGGMGATNYIVGGYSPLTFIGLYILARYLKISNKHFIRWKCGAVFILCTIINSMLYIIGLLFNHSLTSLYSYINPIVIVSACSLLLFFSCTKIKYNKLINYLSKSTFAVFLFHIHPAIKIYFFDRIIVIYDSLSGAKCLFTLLLFLIVVFAISISLDLPRRFLWNFISPFLTVKKKSLPDNEIVAEYHK